MTVNVSGTLGIAMVCVWATAAVRAAGQAADAGRPRFEVASVKQNTGGEQTGFATPQPGRFVVLNVPLRALILRAYRLQPFQLAGGDRWLDLERWDITATIGAGGQAQADAMLQALLEDRFGLVTHRETREGAAYHIVLGRTDGRLGPKLKPAAADCDAGGRPKGPAPDPTAIQTLPPGFATGEITGCRSMRTPGWIMGAGQPMSVLATSLTGTLAAPVVDRTGLAGNYDFSLAYVPDDERVRGAEMPAGFPKIDSNAPTLATAIQEQLGLRLDATRAPMDVLVIDTARRPTGN